MQALSIHLPDGRPLAPRAWASTSTFERAQGWLGRDRVEPGEGLLIVPCNSIHTIGMRFPIDVVYLDRRGRVLKLRGNLKPGRVHLGPWTGLLLPWTVRVLELPAGVVESSGLAVGQTLRLERREP